ncbi:MAG TPA: hypothetical protein VMR97_04575 [Acidimicrobiales bacterium]|nr:hypothetical protein [Acidimicrobiales bacterium]
MPSGTGSTGGPGRVVRVVPDVPALRKTFDYSVPEQASDLVRVGTQVRVVLHGRRVDAWVVEVDVAPDPAIALRAIESVKGWGPPQSVVALGNWAAWRWAGPVSTFLKTASSTRRVAALPEKTARPPLRPGTGVTPSSAGTSSGDTAHRAASLGPPADEAGEQFAEALAGGVTVVRVAPAVHPLRLAIRTAELLEGAADSAGVLVLVPEHDQASRLAARLRASGLAVALLPGEWAAARAGGCVVVGTRAAAMAPLPRLAGAVVLDAHDEGYREQRAPTWCAWEVVAERARRDGAPCALVSPCPTLDLLAAGRLVAPSRRAERGGWAAFEIVDRREDDPRTGLFSERLVTLVRWAGEVSGRRVLCVLNRKGRVRLLACAACREIARCERCNGALELIDDVGARRLRCRRCEAQRPVVCARCGGGKMRAIRVGVSRAREELEALAGTPVAEVWGGAPRSPGDPAEPGTAVTVGTEALLHQARRADAVAFLDFDAELLAPRMRASEEALALLARASRLVAARGGGDTQAGTGRAGGRVLVQTRLPDHEVLTAAVSADPARVADAEEPVRRALGLPPFSALAVISGANADAYGHSLREVVSADVEVSGPTDGIWSLRARSHEELCSLLEAVERPAGRLRVEVDPIRV